MNFTRGVDPKISLSLGIFEKLPKMMENSGYDYEDFLEVWEWAKPVFLKFVILIIFLAGK